MVGVDARWAGRASKNLTGISVQKNDVKTAFGTSVRTWRKRLGLSQAELAERAQLHRTYVSDVERGARNLSLESMTRLAQALRISVADLFPREASNGQSVAVGVNGHSKRLVDILLVEANPDEVALALRACMRVRFANRIQVVGDGQAALDYLFCEGAYADRPVGPPQLVLLDWSLPKVGALDVLRRFKGDERTRGIPVVILTLAQGFNDWAECQRLGAETYLTKPLDFQQLSQVTPRLNLDWALLESVIPARPA